MWCHQSAAPLLNSCAIISLACSSSKLQAPTAGGLNGNPGRAYKSKVYRDARPTPIMNSLMESGGTHGEQNLHPETWP